MMRKRNEFDDRMISHRSFTKILILVIEIALVIFGAFAITHYGMKYFTVSDETMLPNLKMGDKILINQMSYHLHKVKRFDVVLIRESGAEHNFYSLERVVGLPGETIQIKSGVLLINGKFKKEPQNFPKMKNSGLAKNKITLDADEYFVLGDNRNSSEDSRNAEIGNVIKSDIMGKAWIRCNHFAFVRHIHHLK
jgi:signal peptidase I